VKSTFWLPGVDSKMISEKVAIPFDKIAAAVPETLLFSPGITLTIDSESMVTTLSS